jgi:hypothetical protein
MGVFSSNRLASSECTLVNVIEIVVSQFAEGLKSANRQAWTIENEVTAKVFNG